MYKYYESLPTWAKGLIIIAIIALVIYIIMTISKAAKKAKVTQVFKDDYKALVEQGQKPTYPETTYVNLADKIESAGAGLVGGLGTDEEAIYDVFRQMKNDLDVVLLSKAFGTREEQGCYLGCPSLGLGGWLSTELSGEEIKEINNILQATGLTSRF